MFLLHKVLNIICKDVHAFTYASIVKKKEKSNRKCVYTCTYTSTYTYTAKNKKKLEWNVLGEMKTVENIKNVYRMLIKFSRIAYTY